MIHQRENISFPSFHLLFWSFRNFIPIIHEVTSTTKVCLSVWDAEPPFPAGLFSILVWASEIPILRVIDREVSCVQEEDTHERTQGSIPRCEGWTEEIFGCAPSGAEFFHPLVLPSDMFFRIRGHRTIDEFDFSFLFSFSFLCLCLCLGQTDSLE